MKRGEIWWVVFDPSIGGEIQKTRPAIIVSNDIANRYMNRVQVIPVTSQIGKIFPPETIVNVKGKIGKAMADQITTVSKQRLTTYIAKLLPDEMHEVERAIKLQLGL